MRTRSLLWRILLASLGTLLASFVAFVIVFLSMVGPSTERLIRHFQARQIEDAVAALQRGGPDEAMAYLARLDQSLSATHYLTDARGVDLVSGEDRSTLLHAPRGRFGPPRFGDKVVVIEPSDDGRYRLVILATPPLDVWAFAPYYALILAAISFLCWLLALDIVTPLRAVANAVTQFGQGHLDTRVASARRDEIGLLSHAFNDMAARLQTLLTAERRLLQDISHELRSPLARLNIAIELARTADDRDAAAARLQKEVDRLSELVGSLIEVTRAEGDRLHRRSDDIRIGDVLQDVVQASQLEAEARPCRLLVRDTTTRSLIGDREMLRRAIENVVRNAIRHAPAKSAVEIDADDGAHGLTISIRDSGVGVPEATLPHLTKPFFRVEEARDYTANGGVGLGLSIAERAVQLHDGRLSAENAHPGLRVTMTFPVTDAES
jgi:signal transduction histidine kinase